jgi:hypothetical protein
MMKFTPTQLAQMSALFAPVDGPKVDLEALEERLWAEVSMLGIYTEATEGFTMAEWETIREVAARPRDPRIEALKAARGPVKARGSYVSV